MTTPITPEMRELLEEMTTLTRGIDKCRHSMTAILEREDKPSGVWKPEDRETYFVMSGEGPTASTWLYDLRDHVNFARDDCHPTAEACQHAHDVRVAEVKYKRLGKQAWLDEEEVCDWADDGQKYYNYYIHPDEEWAVGTTELAQYARGPYFPSPNTAIAAREAMGSDMDLLI